MLSVYSTTAQLRCKAMRVIGGALAVYALCSAGCNSPYANYSVAVDTLTAEPRAGALSPLEPMVIPASHQAVETPGRIGIAGDAETNEFSVEQTLAYTLDNHPRLRARTQEVEVARADLITAGLIPNPQLVIDAEAPINESGPVDLSGRLMFTFLTGGKRERA